MIVITALILEFGSLSVHQPPLTQHTEKASNEEIFAFVDQTIAGCAGVTDFEVAEEMRTLLVVYCPIEYAPDCLHEEELETHLLEQLEEAAGILRYCSLAILSLFMIEVCQ